VQVVSIHGGEAKRFGRYVVERRIASGGMADVYLARQLGPFGFSKNVALKVLRSEVADDEDHIRMFIREAMVAAEFKHPNLVQVYEVGDAEGRLFIAMELVRGISLATLMQLLARQERSIPISLAARIARDVLDGLAHAHEAVNAEGEALRLVHRDVTPQNVLLDTAGVVKVVDFGIARAETRAGRTQGAQIKGKFGYMAPEQWEASRELDGRTDLFALAVMLYEMSTGSRRLFRGQSAPELFRAVVKDPIAPPSMRVADYPEALSSVVMRGLEREVSARWQSARAMRDALDDVIRAQRWNITSADLARLVDVALEHQTVESRWEEVSTFTPEVTDTKSASELRTSQRAPATESGEQPRGAATVSARPAALSLQEPTTPASSTPPPTVPVALADAPQRLSVGGPPLRNPVVWMGAALAGWLVAFAMGATWWRTRARLDAIEAHGPVAVTPPPPTLREVPEAFTVLSDVALAESVAAPWAELLRGEVQGLRVEVERGNALSRMLQGAGVLALRAGVADVTLLDQARRAGIDLRAEASEHPVGYDHAVVVVHPSNPLPSLRTVDVARIFSGTVRNFRALGGADVHPRIVVCGAGSPTRAFLDDAVMPLDARHSGAVVLRDAEVMADEAATVSRVASVSDAIAVVRLAWVREGVRVVAIASPETRSPVLPTRETIRSGSYPLVRPVLLYSRGAPWGTASRLVRIAQSPAGQTALERAGYVSR
jgi:serine/threonine protein kinase/ABC-type phosphate transport system substrate-binding protein